MLNKRTLKSLLLGLFGVIAVLLLVLIFTIIKALAGPKEPVSAAFGNSEAAPSESSLADALPLDTKAPVIDGVRDLEIYVGSTISYLGHITVSDDLDPAPSITVDDSEVNLKEPGFYFAKYIASDASGNQSEAQFQVIVQDLSALGVTEEDVYEMARHTISLIISNDMTKTEIAKAIFDWTNQYIIYIPYSAERDILSAAYVGFRDHQGDCYVAYATAKYLLDLFDIPNVSISRQHEDDHYWMLVNLGTGWYHYDSSMSAKTDPYECFMKTDAEIAAYAASRSDGRTYYYDFDKSLYENYPRETVPFAENQP